MFENNGFAFDSAGSFFGESTTPSFENGFSNAGPSDGFFGESAFDENGFSTPETSAFGESASYGGGFTQFGSAFSESAFDESGFSTDSMFCEEDNSVDSDKKGDYIDKHKGENAIGTNRDFRKAKTKRHYGSFMKTWDTPEGRRTIEGLSEEARHEKKEVTADEHKHENKK